MRDDWRDALLARHPARFAPGAIPAVGDGWRDLVERAVGRIAAASDREDA